MNQDWHIRPATPADAEACGRIIFDAFNGIAELHNFPKDFSTLQSATELAALFCNHPRTPGFVAEENGRIAGSNFLDERNVIGGVGPITVDPGCQSRGCGRRLMQTVLERGRNAPGIRLVQDAFNTVSMALYASLGFEVREPLALMSGRPTAPLSADALARAMRPEDLPACGELCRQTHGFDRNGELADALKLFRATVIERGGSIVAYASAPPLWPLNHGLAQTDHDMQDLIVASASVNGGAISLLIPTRRTSLFRWCLGVGLRIVKPMTLMSIGSYQEPCGPFFPSVGY